MSTDKSDISPLAIFQSAVYGNDQLLLQKQKRITKQSNQALLDITEKIRLFQCSSELTNNEAHHVLDGKNTTKYLSCQNAQEWFIFDCATYEIEKIDILFGNGEIKPKTLKIRTSDIPNAYSFRNKTSAKILDLQSLYPKQESKKDDINNTNDKDIEPVKIHISLTNDKIYSNGFKRYLQFIFKHIDWRLEIIQINFYGKKSQQIAKESEQFDHVLDKHIFSMNNTDEKQAILNEQQNGITNTNTDSNQYKPKVLYHSESSSTASLVTHIFTPKLHQYHIYNTWDCKFIKEDSESFNWLIIDLGNNDVDEIKLTLGVRAPCQSYKIFTADDTKIEDNEWILLHENNNILKTLFDGNYYNIKGKHKKLLKIIFLGKGHISVAEVLLFGNSKYLHQKEKKLTMKDIEGNDEHFDYKLIEKYVTQKEAEIKQKMMKVWLESNEMKLEREKTNGDMDEKEINLQKLKQELDDSIEYFQAEIYAKFQETDFDEKEALQLLKIRKKIKTECFEKVWKIKKEFAFKINNAKKEEGKAHDEYIKNWNAKNSQFMNLWDEKKNAHQNLIDLQTQKVAEIETKQNEELHKLYADDSDGKLELIWKEWKDSITNHPKILSSQYNISEYQNMINNYGTHQTKNNLWLKLADLLYESIQKQIATMHKYHLYRLSLQENVYPPMKTEVQLLFDCGRKYIGKVQYIDLHMVQSCFANKIQVFTTNELIEEKVENINIDCDEIGLDYNTFEKIGEIQVMPETELKAIDRYNTSDLIVIKGKIELNCMNNRFIRMVFSDMFGDICEPLKVRIDRMRFYIKSSDDNEIDDDLILLNATGLDKFKLELVGCPGNNIKKTLETAKRYIQSVYNDNENDVFYDISRTDEHYLIFDCETRKVDKIAIKFAAHASFECLKVFTSDNYNHQQNNNVVWNEIFTELFQFKSDTNREKEINISCNNDRYIKLEAFKCKNGNLAIAKMKFHTIDPEKYKWPSDYGLKNLSSKIQIVYEYCTEPMSKRNKIDFIFKPIDYGRRRNFEFYTNKIDENNNIYKDVIGRIIRDEICKGLNKFRNNGSMNNNYKHYVKYLLCWENENNYSEILDTAKRIMSILQKPLIKEYKKLQSKNSKILSIKLDKSKRLPSNIVSNHGLLEWSYNKWYAFRKAIFFPKDIKPLITEWKSVGLQIIDTDLKQIKQQGFYYKDITYTSCDELALEFINFVAITLDPAFQQSMKDLFIQNRQELNLEYPPKTNRNNIGVLSGPIKTKSRQKIKIAVDYKDKPHPRCMNVLDIVRCAIVCQDDNELFSLYKLIEKTYGGKILRIKNAFDDITKGTFGYRAILINIAYSNEKVLPKEYQIIVEIQLLLLNYYIVRKDMHLGYNIVRSEEGGDGHETLAIDSCKLGKLDI